VNTKAVDKQANMHKYTNIDIIKMAL